MRWSHERHQCIYLLDNLRISKRGYNFKLLFCQIEDKITDLDIWGDKQTAAVPTYELYEQKALEAYQSEIGAYPIMCDNAHP